MTNNSIFKATNIKSFKFGDTLYSEADLSSALVDLKTAFNTNNATPLLDVVGTVDANNPAESAAFAESIAWSGNERGTSEQDLLGEDTSGAQNKEVTGSTVSPIVVTVTMVYRNNVPFSIFNDTTKSAFCELDNEESAATGKVNFAFNNITLTKVGDLDMQPDGLIKQTMTFTMSAGTSGTPITVDDSSNTWSKVRGGDYAEEVQLT